MALLTGNSTTDTKIAAQSRVYYNLNAIERVGKVVMTAVASATWTENTAYTLPDAGLDLAVRTRVAIVSASDMVVTVSGTDSLDAAIEGVATIEAQVAPGQAYELVVSGGEAFKTVTGVTATNGVIGDSFDILTMPDRSGSNDVLLFRARVHL